MLRRLLAIPVALAALALLGGGVPASAGPADIPDDFPLDHGLVSDGDFTVTGPGPGARGIRLRELCGSKAWPGSPDDRLVVRQLGPESAVIRELVTYPTAHDAAVELDRLRDAVAACPVAPAAHRRNDLLFTVLDADAGYDSLTFGETYRTGLGGAVFQFVRVGHAILAVLDGGEWAPDSIKYGARHLTRQGRYLTARMCVFTRAGC